MLYLLFVFCFVCAILSNHFDYYSSCELDFTVAAISSDSELDFKEEEKEFKRYSFLSTALLVAFIVGAIVALAGTVYVCNSDFLTTTVEQSSITYQVTDFNAEKNHNETKYTATVEENLKIEISSKDSDKYSDTEIVCNSYNPQTLTVEENHYYKWWFMCTYDTYTYTFS